MSQLAGVIQGVHGIIAFQRKEPHWLLNDADATKYGTALGNALRHLPIKTAQKTIDFTALVMVAFVIETPRIVASANFARAPKQPTRGPAQVFQFHNPNQASPASQPSPPPAQAPTSPTAEPSPGIMADPPDLGPENAIGGEI